MTQKKLQNNSKLNPLDVDGDGVVDDHELHVAEVEHDLRKQRAQRRMATETFRQYHLTLLLFCNRLKRKPIHEKHSTSPSQ